MSEDLPSLIPRRCAVCGDTPAKVHYGVLACFGCKGFFRRAVKDGRNKYVCRFEKNCQVTKFERNACRYCRFRECLRVGMNPDFVRPDREEKSKSHPKLRPSLSKKKSLGRTCSNKLEDVEHWSDLLTASQRKLLNDLSELEGRLQIGYDHNFDRISDFCLKSMIADRSLARKNMMTEPVLSKRPCGESLLSIERLVSATDFIDGFITIAEQDTGKKTSIEDKSCLVSSVSLHLILVDIAAKLVSKKCTNYSDELIKMMDGRNIEPSILNKFSFMCELFKKRCPSTVEYSLLRAIFITSADSSVLSNAFNELLDGATECLQELLFRIIKLSRGKGSAYAANYMANLIHFLHYGKDCSSLLRDALQPHFPRDQLKMHPFERIRTDIINPEVSDLLITMNRKSFTESYKEFNPSTISSSPATFSQSSLSPPNSYTPSSFAPPQTPPSSFAPPSFPTPSSYSNSFAPPTSYSGSFAAPIGFPSSSSYGGSFIQQRNTSNMTSFNNPSTSNQTPQDQQSSSNNSNNLRPPVFHNFQSPQPIRPSTLAFRHTSFSSKIPLTMTKSIEEMLRPAGMTDESILNRPLAGDWADGLRLTPVINRDVVAHFFPELNGTQWG